tara:strand:- start:86 stop:235 length:150 start_codon:yes stop_codon:yes gene_type:complete
MNSFDYPQADEVYNADTRTPYDYYSINDIDSDEWMSTEELAEFGLTRQG